MLGYTEGKCWVTERVSVGKQEGLGNRIVSVGLPGG